MLIPAYNEAATIGKVIAKVLDRGVVKEVIVVDVATTGSFGSDSWRGLSRSPAACSP